MLFIVIVLSIPMYILTIWGLKDPQNAILFMDRWRYDENPEFSDLQMTMFKWKNIAAIVIITMLIIGIGIITFTS